MRSAAGAGEAKTLVRKMKRKGRDETMSCSSGNLEKGGGGMIGDSPHGVTASAAGHQ